MLVKSQHSSILILTYTSYVTLSKSAFRIVADRDFLGGPLVKTSPSNAGGSGSIPGQGAKFPCASGPKNPKHKTEAIMEQIQ